VQVVNRLVGSLLRSLGSHEHWPWLDQPSSSGQE
jgi:hypothetical protein